MNTSPRAMDDLDRLAFRIARTARTHYPHLLAHGFTLADLEERLAPFHETRRELADGGADGYETTLLRLVAGERGYLAADASLQAACRDALGRPSPTVAFVRAWAGAPLTLAGGALALATPGSTSGAASSIDGAVSSSGDWAHGEPLPAPAFPAAGRRESRAVTTGRGVGTVTDVTAPPATRCRYCGGGLPQDRHAVFCPHCGLNLTTRQCPACSSELDVTWRFCVTCGRDATLPELPADGETDAPTAGASPPAVDPLGFAIGDALAEALDGAAQDRAWSPAPDASAA